MIKSLPRLVASLLMLTAALAPAAALALVQSPVVRAILFFSPTCPHCHTVIREDLPIVFANFGGEPQVYYDRTAPVEELAFYDVSNGQLEILLVDVSRLRGYDLFAASSERFGDIVGDSRGVPRLVIGDTVLIGSLDIPSTLPRLVAQGLAAGGIDWPDLPGMQQAVASVPGRPLAVADTVTEGEGAVAEAEGAAETQPVTEPEGPVETESPGEGREETGPATGARPGVESAPAREPEPEGTATEGGSEAAVTTEPGDTGAAAASAEGVTEVDEPGDTAATSLAVIPERRPSMIELYSQDPVGNSISVVVLIGMLLSLLVVAARPRVPIWRRELGVEIVLISLLGIGVASYLTYVESLGVLAVCGPVGDCNTVQQSQYAKLFGVIPVGALGLAGYVAIIAAWLVTKRYSGAAADWARVSLLGMTVVGTLFSVYLTFLEPFVIGATCAWCLTSAVVITLLMWLSARPGLEAWARVRRTN